MPSPAVVGDAVEIKYPRFTVGILVPSLTTFDTTLPLITKVTSFWLASILNRRNGKVPVVVVATPVLTNDLMTPLTRTIAYQLSFGAVELATNIIACVGIVATSAVPELRLLKPIIYNVEDETGKYDA